VELVDVVVKQGRQVMRGVGKSAGTLDDQSRLVLLPHLIK
jgi:hypothetical protein